MSFERNEVNKNSFGGTELMMERLHSSFPSDFLNEYQIIASRVREIDEDKLRVYWCHDLAGDPETHHLKDGGWAKFHRLVFVSHWQRMEYIRLFNIPWSKTVVLQNAITPIEAHEKPSPDVVNLIYHTTPHRGLELLVPVFEKLSEDYGDSIHLDVYSSFQIYGWEQRDENYQPLFDRIEDHPNMTYHGFKPNVTIREALQKAHIHAYPSIWHETSCISLMEAMSAGCVCVHPDLAALPETAANWTIMYPWHEDHNRHAGQFYSMLRTAIDAVKDQQAEGFQIKLKGQKSYTDLFYSWDLRKLQWEAFLKSFYNEPRTLEKASGPIFSYEVA